MRAATLLALLLLASPAGARTWAQYPYPQFRALVARASSEIGLLSPPETRQGRYVGGEEFIAWVVPPLPIIWIDPEYLHRPVENLCVTAYHEVIHLWMAQDGQEDLDDHEVHDGWMAFFMVEARCFGERGDAPEWEGVGYMEFMGGE